MIHDAALPPRIEPTVSTAERNGVCYLAARWSSGELERLARRLAGSGPTDLARIATGELLQAWSETVEAFRNPDSAERQVIDPALTRLCRLSGAGLEAGLDAVLGGVSGSFADTLAAEAEAWRRSTADRPFVAVSLASNLPALAVQPLLPALLLRCPVLLKSPTTEPLFAPAFVSSLTHRLPALKSAAAAVTWTGGDVALETPVLELADRVLAYGDQQTLDDLRQRVGDKLFAYGPKASLAVLGADTIAEEVAEGIGRDIALFDQRGCLSIQSIFTAGDPAPLARALADQLRHLAHQWPPGTLDPVAAAAVQQIRSEAALRDLRAPDLPLATGTIIVEPEPRFQPGPGLRTVRIHPLPSLEALPEILVEWSGRLQGAALAGRKAWALRPHLEGLGISRFAPPGRLQTPDAGWHNGGVHPFTALTGVSL